MLSKLKIVLVIASFFLVSCAPQTAYVASNPVKNERLRSARVIYDVPLQMKLVYGVGSMDRGDAAYKNALDHILPLTKAMQEYVAPQVVSALAKKGVSPGADAIIYLRPVQGYVGSGTKVRLELTVRSSDQSKQPWTAHIFDGSAVGSSTGEKNAQVFSDRVIFELVKAGFLPE